MRTINNLLRSVLILTLTISAYISALGQTYYTLKDGDWNDNTVWSMDGVTPCNCSPDYTLDNENVMIRHMITSSEVMRIHDGCMLEVESGCTLFCPDKEFYVEGGELIAYGELVLDKFYIYPDATVEMYSGSTIGSECDIQGTLDMIFPVFDTVYIDNTNFKIHSGAKVTIENACMEIVNGNIEDEGMLEMDACVIDISNGNLYNYDTLKMGGTCVTVINGNVKNESGHVVMGAGAIRVENGNIENFGQWSPDVHWCASGNGVGMPLPENCEAVDIICENTTLAVDFGELWLVPKPNAIQVNWQVFTEQEMAKYAVERSLNGIDFKEIGEVLPENHRSAQFNYSFVDNYPYVGTAFYRIAALDNDGITTLSGMKSITFGLAEGLSMKVFPNPIGEEDLQVLVYSAKGQATGQLTIFNSTGQRVHFQDIDFNQAGFYHWISTDSWASGIYLVRFRTDNIDLAQKLVVAK